MEVDLLKLFCYINDTKDVIILKVESSNLETIAVRTSQYPTDERCEFLLCGRSNVGKSSFINTILGRKNYAHTSGKSGKTQTLNFYLVNEDFYLVDVPGYGYADVSKEKQRKFENKSDIIKIFFINNSF